MDRLRLAVVAALSIALTAPAGISPLAPSAWAAGSTKENPAATPEPSKKKKEKKKGLSLWNRLRTEEGNKAPETSAEVPEGEAEKVEAAQPAVEVEPVAPKPPEPLPPPPTPKGTKPEPPHPKEEPPAEPASHAKARPVAMRSLSKVHDQILVTPLAQDPIARGYLEAIESGGATPERLNEFAIYLGRKGYTGPAVEVQEEVVRRSPKNPLFWINLGTLHREAGKTGLAKSDFRKAINLDPNNAFAYYNLGAVLDAEARYDEAIEMYKKALRLDPSLSDPRRNPQVVNNQRLLAVSLLLYREAAGALGLPLLSAAPAADDSARRARKKSKSEESPARP